MIIKSLLVSLLVAAVAADYDIPYCDGKQVIVHLFEWKWNDIAEECERFLGPKQFCAVQVSPPMEHILKPDVDYPWWQRYQPISYILQSRSGDEDGFADMVNRCNNVGVKVIVDAVFNHMAGKDQSGTGSAGSHFDADALDFPGVPYDTENFTPRDMCPSGDGNINDYSNIDEVKNCDLSGLTDLYTAYADTQKKISDYLSHLVDLGVMGFRVDASKHMWPDDLTVIEGMVHDLSSDFGFPDGARPFFYHEVIDQGNEPVTVDQYYDLGRVCEFRYCTKIKEGIEDFGRLENLYDPGWGMAEPDKAFVFVDNHDTQRNGGVLTYKDGNLYTMGVAYTLAYDYGFTRIMSSYDFDTHDQGPPSDNDGHTNDVPINADGSCGGGWVCEHRWQSITNMVPFRNAVVGTSRENYIQDGDTVAFSRGDKGFFAMNKQGSLDQTFQTGMPAGDYCELISNCDKTITVNSDGTAHIAISDSDNPIAAICVGCNGGYTTSHPYTTGSHGPTTSGPTTTAGPTTSQGPTSPPIDGVATTIIFMHKQTDPGQDLFIRGGIGEDERPGCTKDAETDICALDITKDSLGAGDHYAKYDAWSDGDTKLDWYGAQDGQGEYEGQAADGTSLAWTTNDPTAEGYQELNKYGPHYWMAQMEVNCTQSEGGWFELKAYLTNAGDGWETDVTQDASCDGAEGGSAPYTSKNHMAKCGYVNVFDFSGDSCTIDIIPK